MQSPSQDPSPRNSKNKTKKVEFARSQAQALEEAFDVDDLEGDNRPKDLMLSYVSGEKEKERSNRERVTTWFKFLCETYRVVLEILMNNSKLMALIHLANLNKYRDKRDRPDLSALESWIRILIAYYMVSGPCVDYHVLCTCSMFPKRNPMTYFKPKLVVSWCIRELDQTRLTNSLHVKDSYNHSRPAYVSNIPDALPAASVASATPILWFFKCKGIIYPSLVMAQGAIKNGAKEVLIGKEMVLLVVFLK
ncbi:eukaryotic translation initiation factor 3 subunit A-like protein [Tanacetum coccineum]